MRPYRKMGVPMCQKLQDIHGFQPEQILNSYGEAVPCPVDVRRILKNMRINCLSADVSNLERSLQFQAGTILGMAAARGNDLLIVSSDALPLEEANYVFAHELAHCCLHLPVSSEFHVELKTTTDFYSCPPQSGFDGFSARKEAEADDFAARLLLPEAELRRRLSQHPRPDAKQLAAVFQVPVSLAETRLRLMS